MDGLTEAAISIGHYLSGLFHFLAHQHWHHKPLLGGLISPFGGKKMKGAIFWAPAFGSWKSVAKPKGKEGLGPRRHGLGEM